jgi:hypothetical protein
MGLAELVAINLSTDGFATRDLIFGQAASDYA